MCMLCSDVRLQRPVHGALAFLYQSSDVMCIQHCWPERVCPCLLCVASFITHHSPQPVFLSAVIEGLGPACLLLILFLVHMFTLLCKARTVWPEAQSWSPVQRFAWEINPRNYLLLACHAANETVQLNQLRRWYGYHYGDPTKTTPQVELAGTAHYICQNPLPVLWSNSYVLGCWGPSVVKQAHSAYRQSMIVM